MNDHVTNIRIRSSSSSNQAEVVDVDGVVVGGAAVELSFKPIANRLEVASPTTTFQTTT